MKKDFRINKFLEMTEGNQVHFFEEGEAYYQHYLKLIKNAKESIHLQTYIFEIDKFGSQVHQELISAALRGVKIYLLVDSIGSRKLEQNAIDKLISAGIYFYQFNEIKLKWLMRWGRRLHHKILLVDHQLAIIGGINVCSNSFFENNLRPNLDFAVSIKGPSIFGLVRYCEYIYKMECSKDINFNLFTEKNNHNFNAIQNIKLKISVNDWVFRHFQITRNYAHLIKSAQHDIIIVHSYFFPRKKVMKQLAGAAKRGVRVRLILPKYSDWPSYVFATQYLYSYFFAHGVEIYQWKKSNLHGKLVTIDNSSLTVGSFNLNYTSYRQNLEMNVDIFSTQFVKNINLRLNEIINSGCEKLDENKFLKEASIRIKLLRLFYFIVLSIVANFSVLFTFQEKISNKNK